MNEKMLCPKCLCSNVSVTETILEETCKNTSAYSMPLGFTAIITKKIMYNCKCLNCNYEWSIQTEKDSFY